MNNEEMITEASLIPQNFSWRAGIGTNVPGAAAQPTGHGQIKQSSRHNQQKADAFWN